MAENGLAADREVTYRPGMRQANLFRRRRSGGRADDVRRVALRNAL
jgi:hypothetical protein